MTSWEKYRARAVECIEAAERVADPQCKLTLVELAQRWIRLAMRKDSEKSRTSVQGGVLFPGADKRTH